MSIRIDMMLARAISVGALVGTLVLLAARR